MKVLQTQGLAIGYRPARRPPIPVAENLNLSLSAGELVCLMGANGAGKSTLLRTLAGMQAPLGGMILLQGDELARLSPLELAHRLSIVLTERLDAGMMTGYSLVALGRHPHTGWWGQLSADDEAVIQWAVGLVGAEALAPRPVAELSDGERQKLLIARALAQETPLILLDEPTAFLDLPRRVEMMQLLRHLARSAGRAILMSTHDLDLALRSADRLWLLPPHAPMQIGAPEDLILNGAFEQVFEGNGLIFNRATGTFAIQMETPTPVQLSGTGLAHTWTQRALERAGYQVLDNAPLKVSVVSQPDKYQWHIDTPTQQKRAASIEECLQILAQTAADL